MSASIGVTEHRPNLIVPVEGIGTFIFAPRSMRNQYGMDPPAGITGARPMR